MYYGNSSVGADPSSTNTWDTNYLGIWHLEESGDGTGNEYNDASGTGNHGQGGSGDSNKTPVQSTNGVFSNAQDFDGSNDYIDLGTINPTSVTVSAWVKREGNGDGQGWQDIVGNQDFNNGGYLLFLFPEATGVYWRTNYSGGNDNVNGSATTSDWHLYTGTFTGSTSRAYIDGVLVDTDNTASLAASGKDMSIGDDAVGGNNGFFDGLIDEVRISDVARSTDWIATEYNNQNDPSTFYSIAAADVAPGNVSTNLTLWLKADAGICGSPTVTGWLDQSVNGYNTTGSGNPQLVSDAINFNPAIDFDAAGDYFTTAATSLIGSSNPYTKYVVITPDVIGSVKNLIGTDATSNLEMRLSAAGELKARHNGTGLLLGASAVAGKPLICGLRYGVGGINNVVRVDGAEVVDNTTPGYTDVGTTQIGGRWSGTNLFDGYIAEAIVYNTEIADADIVKIESYLAIKYGITLDNTAGGTTGDYVATDGSTIWDASDGSTYQNDIVIIGRDDAEALYQKQSKSPDDSVKIFIDAIAADNAANAGSITNDVSYLVIGHNGERLLGQEAEMPAGIFARFQREWKITNTNFDDNFSLEFEWEEAGAFDIDDIRLLVDADGDFSDATILSTANGLTFTEGSIIVGGITTGTGNHIPTGTSYLTLASMKCSDSFTDRIAQLHSDTDG